MTGLISRALAPRPKNLQINTPAELDAFLRRGDETWSGMDVSEQTAMNVSAFSAGVRYVSEDVGKLPWPVFRRAADDDRVRATDSPYWTLLHDAPNAWMDSQQFRELGTAIALIRGDFVALKNVNNGVLQELLPVKPDRVTIEQLPDYGLIYTVRMASGQPKQFGPRDVFHFRGFSLDGVHGMSVLAMARQALGLSLAIQRHGASTFKNGAKAAAVYRHPGELSDRAYTRLKDDLDDLKGEGAGGSLILEEGMDWTQVGMTNEDAQYLGSAQFQIAEFCRHIRIAPHKLFDLTRSTNNNIEHQSIEYVQDTLFTWGTRWDRAAKRQVIGKIGPRSNEYAETNYDAVLRTTAKERAEVARLAVGRPWMTGNEWRRFDNLPRVDDDPSMDEVILPKNLDAGGPGPANQGGAGVGEAVTSAA